MTGGMVTFDRQPNGDFIPKRMPEYETLEERFGRQAIQRKHRVEILVALGMDLILGLIALLIGLTH